jgi:AAA ATPase domain
MYTFLDEYFIALGKIKGQIKLPINESRFEYDEQLKRSFIIGEDYRLDLSKASSGFQSIVPLFIVSLNLAFSLNGGHKDKSVSSISTEDQKRIRKEIALIMSNDKLSDDIKQATLEFLSSKFSYSAFINIVEEPEQNLFPSAQMKLLFSLIDFNHTNTGNKLIMTTHSPYLISYMTLAVKAFDVWRKVNTKYNSIKNTLQTDEELRDNTEAKKRTETELFNIVPSRSFIDSGSLSIYQLDEKDGSIKKLDKYQGLPSNENYLDDAMTESNDLFAKLLDIEDSCR